MNLKKIHQPVLKFRQESSLLSNTSMDQATWTIINNQASDNKRHCEIFMLDKQSYMFDKLSITLPVLNFTTSKLQSLVIVA